MTLVEIPVCDISEYINTSVEFTSDNKSFIMTADKKRWSLLYDDLDTSIINEWHKEHNVPDDLEGYYKFIIERAVTYQSYYIANEERVACLVAVKKEYGAEQQAIGAFQFDYVFDGSGYMVSSMDFMQFYTIEELNSYAILLLPDRNCFLLLGFVIRSFA